LKYFENHYPYGVIIVAIFQINRLIFTNKCKGIYKNVSNSQIAYKCTESSSQINARQS